MVVSGSVLGPEPAGWPVKDLRVNKVAQDRLKTKAGVDAYVMTQKPTKIVYDVWNPFNTRGVGNMGGNESLYSLDRVERLETLRQLGIPIPNSVAPGEEDIYITNVLSDYGVGSLEQWINMTANERKKKIDEANKRDRKDRPTTGGNDLKPPPVDDDPFEKISQGFNNLSSVLRRGSFQIGGGRTIVPSTSPQLQPRTPSRRPSPLSPISEPRSTRRRVRRSTRNNRGEYGRGGPDQSIFSVPPRGLWG